MDKNYFDLNYKSCVISHHYKKKLFLLKNPYLQTLLAKFSSNKTTWPMLNYYLKSIYTVLLTEVVNNFFNLQEVKIKTRMYTKNSKGIYHGEIINPKIKVVCADIARAGNIPTLTIYELLTFILDPCVVRIDHFYMNRKVNKNKEVVGIDFAGSKVGGSIDDAYLLIPDPMGATASSINYVIDYYKDKGKPLGIITMHAMITPEYIKNINSKVVIFAGRLDRGLSSSKILNSLAGKFSNERGLDDHQYIIPGAGGVGEILSNSWV